MSQLKITDEYIFDRMSLAFPSGFEVRNIGLRVSGANFSVIIAKFADRQ